MAGPKITVHIYLCLVYTYQRSLGRHEAIPQLFLCHEPSELESMVAAPGVAVERGV